MSLGLVGFDRKSDVYPSLECLAIERALAAAGRTKVPIPIYLGRKHLGWTLAPDGVPGWLPNNGLFATYGSYDDIIAACAAGKRLPIVWYKNASSSSAATTNYYDSWPLNGSPIGGTINGTARTARQFDDSTQGAIAHGGNVSTDTKHLLSVGATYSQAAVSMLIYDRVLSYDQCNFSNVSQTMTNTLTAQRYNGAGLSGMQMMLTAGTTAYQAGGTSLATIGYTNQDGTTTRATGSGAVFISGIPAASTTQAARIGCPASSGQTVTWGPFMFMQAGDWGVRSVEDYQCGAIITGNFTLVLARPLFWLPIPASGVPAQVDAVVQVASLERIYDGACLAAVYSPAGTSGGYLTVNMEVGWG